MQSLGLALLVLAGCYAPFAAEGAPCATSDQCPSQQRCVLGQCSLTDRDAAVPPDRDAPSIDDAPPGDAPPLRCGFSSIVCNGNLSIMTCAQRCWLICSEPVSRAAALDRCTGWPGMLAEIDSPDEQACLNDKVIFRAWSGLAQSQNQASAGAGWTWNATRSLAYTNWQLGAPNDLDGVENNAEQCGLLQPNGTWDDEACNFPAGFACERAYQ